MTDQQALIAKEAAYILNIGMRTMYKLLKSGKLKGFRVGDQWRIRRADLNKFMGVADDR
jgi:excisionase family DNA binding protein